MRGGACHGRLWAHVPEVEGADDPAGVEEEVGDQVHDAVVVIAAHGGVRVGHDDAPRLQGGREGGIVRRGAQAGRVEEAAVERGVVVERGDGEAVAGRGGAMHVAGRLERDPPRVLMAWLSGEGRRGRTARRRGGRRRCGGRVGAEAYR